MSSVVSGSVGGFGFKKVRLGLHNITVDPELQSRVRVDMDHMRALSEVRVEGREFSMPVVVFFDGKKNWLADGFHRHGAAKAVGDKDILAEVHSGTREDAMVFSAGANQEFSLRRTKDDIRKSLTMLFAIEEWFFKSLKVISGHVGVSSATVSKYRLIYCNENRIPPPSFTVSSDGSMRDSQQKGKIKVYACGLVKIGQTNITTRRPGETDEQAIHRAKSLLADKTSVRVSLTINTLRSWLNCRQIAVLPSPCVGTFSLGNIIPTSDATCVTWGDEKEDICRVVGRLMLARVIAGRESTRAVVLCYLDSRDTLAFQAATKLGIEFLTPQEFVVSVNCDSEKSA